MKNDKYLYQQLSSVMDPELQESVVDLGLIYGVEKRNDTVIVTMTLTTPFCPLAPQIQHDIEACLLACDGVKHVDINLVWDPPWDVSTMASDEIKDKLGLW